MLLTGLEIRNISRGKLGWFCIKMMKKNYFTSSDPHHGIYRHILTFGVKATHQQFTMKSLKGSRAALFFFQFVTLKLLQRCVSATWQHKCENTTSKVTVQ